MDIAGFASYLTGAAAFLALTTLLLTSWRGRLQGALLVGAALISMLWCGFLAFAASGTEAVALAWILAAEIARDAIWLTFLLRLLGAGAGASLPSRLSYIIYPLSSGLLLYVVAISVDPAIAVTYRFAPVVPVAGLFVLALMGLMLVEQLYRNSPASQRWAIKFLCMGLAALFAYDLVIYSYALMLHAVNRSLWDARGWINAIVVPLIAVSAARNPTWSLDVFVSRKMVFYSTTLLGAGVYLVAVAAGGYYIRLYGGTWGTLVSVIFLFAATLGLLMLLMSGQARARVRVFVSKHFFNYRYDYREEWLRLIATLSGTAAGVPLPRRCLTALAQITDSSGGLLCLRRDDGRFQRAAEWNMSPPLESEPADSSFVRFLETRQWIFDLEEWREDPASYPDVDVPAWLQQASRAWIVIPLLQDASLLGFVVLARARAHRALNWEDLDLLKTAGRQVASYLSQADSARKLAEARQFEGYNRLTAFLMHDLKNLVAQQSLMVTNAEKFKHNPAFVDDMITTVSSSVARMNRLLEQLRRGEIKSEPRRVSLGDLVQQALADSRGRRPVPSFAGPDENIPVSVEPDRFCAILGHVIRNAQEATPAEGHVRVVLQRVADKAIIEVQDNGEGMDAEFVRERLFQPFYTTKSSKGMGVGAYQVREYVTGVGGSVDVVSAPRQGTTFTITLPVAASEAVGRDAERPEVEG